MNSLRVCTRAGSAFAALVALSFISGSATAAGAAPDLNGTWWATEYHAKIQPVGGDLPFTAKGKAAYAMNMANLKAGLLDDNSRKFCVPDGVPRVLETPYPFELIQGPPGQVTFVHELNHQLRVVALDKPMPPAAELIPAPFYNGHSVGHYEGDTLVIESAGFNDKTFLDSTGTPHTDEMTTVERVRKTSPTELEDVITIHDPQYYSKDWQARFVYTLRNDVRLEDYVCGEKHRDLSSVKGVHPQK
jgi:hypothetical protein